MKLQGDFEGQALSTILQMLCDEQQTGLLKVTGDSEESRVFFQGGEIIYAISTKKETKLASILLRAGVVTQDQLQSSLKKANEQKEFFGKILIDEGYITEEKLKEFNQKQVEDILYDLLFWKNGEFIYKSGKLNLGNVIVSKLVPMKLIMEVARRIDEMSVIQEMIPDENVIFKQSPKMVTATEDIKLTPVEWRLIGLVDGRRTIKELVDECGYVLFEAYKILFSASMSGIIEISEHVQVSAEEDADNDFDFSVEEDSDVIELIDDQEAVSSSNESDAEDTGGIDEKTALFLEEVKKVLAVAIGPAAKVVLNDQFNEWLRLGKPELSRIPELVELLAQEIDEPKLSVDFRKKALSLYETSAQPSSKGQEDKGHEDLPEKPIDNLDEKSKEILKEIKEALAYAIGPAAGVILDDSMKRVGAEGNLSQEQFSELIEILKEEIGNATLTADFARKFPLFS